MVDILCPYGAMPPCIEICRNSHDSFQLFYFSSSSPLHFPFSPALAQRPLPGSSQSLASDWAGKTAGLSQVRFIALAWHRRSAILNPSIHREGEAFVIAGQGACSERGWEEKAV